MNIKLHILNASGKLTPYVQYIEKTFLPTVEKVLQVLPVDNTDIVVWEYPDWTIEQYGIGGHTMMPNEIMISLNPSNPRIQTSFSKIFEQTIVHEMHHAARLQALGFDYASRLEISIREGLAEHFEIELTDKKPEIWDRALTKEQLGKFSEIAKTNKSVDDYHVYDWLFGKKELDIPEWTGYSVGFYLVEEYLKKHPREKPSSIYNKKAEEFI